MLLIMMPKAEPQLRFLGRHAFEAIALGATPLSHVQTCDPGEPAKQYRNGGSEPTAGFDCSGLVQWVFAQHGTALPRETREQYEIGRKIDQDEVRPGDLVFFKTVSKGPSHVGIALGGGEFVHAPSSRGVVRVESYTKTEYWADRWLGAKRITPTSQSTQ